MDKKMMRAIIGLMACAAIAFGFYSCSDDIDDGIEIPENVGSLMENRQLDELNNVVNGEELFFQFHDWRFLYEEERKIFIGLTADQWYWEQRYDGVIFREGKVFRYYGWSLRSSDIYGVGYEEKDEVKYKYCYGDFMFLLFRLPERPALISEQECCLTDPYPWFEEKLWPEQIRERVEILRLKKNQLLTTNMVDCEQASCEAHQFRNRLFEWYSRSEMPDFSSEGYLVVNGARDYYEKMIDLMLQQYGPYYEYKSLGPQRYDINAMREAIMADLDEGVFNPEHWQNITVHL